MPNHRPRAMFCYHLPERFLIFGLKTWNVNSLATVDLDIFGYFSIFQVLFSSWRLFSQKLSLLLYNAVVLVICRRVCSMSLVSGSSPWNWQSRQSSGCQFSPWETGSGALSCSLHWITIGANCKALSNYPSDPGNLGKSILGSSLSWDIPVTMYNNLDLSKFSG